MKYLAALVFFACNVCNIYTQKAWVYARYFSFGLHLNFNHGRQQHFPCINIYGGFAISAEYKNRFIIN